MPRRSTQQNLRNFEAIALALEPLAVVNAELSFGNIKTGRSRHAPLGQSRLWAQEAPSSQRRIEPQPARYCFFTVLAGAFAGAAGFLAAGLVSATVLMSAISLVMREALLPRSLSK